VCRLQDDTHNRLERHAVYTHLRFNQHDEWPTLLCVQHGWFMSRAKPSNSTDLAFFLFRNNADRKGGTLLTLWQRKSEERALYYDAVWGIEEASATVRAHLLPFIEVDC